MFPLCAFDASDGYGRGEFLLEGGGGFGGCFGFLFGRVFLEGCLGCDREGTNFGSEGLWMAMGEQGSEIVARCGAMQNAPSE